MATEIAIIITVANSETTTVAITTTKMAAARNATSAASRNADQPNIHVIFKRNPAIATAVTFKEKA
jgi:pyruvate/2-oxoacid:ferredoxin oxidoreductase beta subunit